MASNNRLQVVLNHLQSPLSRNVSTKKYRYTVNNNLLSEEQRQFYEENGFLVIRNLINENLLDEFRKRFVDICFGKVDIKDMILMKDKSMINTGARGEHLYYKVQDFMWDEILSKYLINPLLLDYVQCFIGPNFHVIQSMLINKPPDTGVLTSQHPIHQDLHYFPFGPAERVVGVWTAIDRAYVENGGLYIVPGTHKAALQPHGYPEHDANITYHSIQGFDKIQKLSLIMEPGDTVFFSPLIFHGSWPNNTKGFRKCISCHYASSDCHFFEVKGTRTQEVAEEIEKLYSRKLGYDINYLDIWRRKKRLIKGYEGTLM